MWNSFRKAKDRHAESVLARNSRSDDTISVADPGGRTTEYAYDHRGERAQVCEFCTFSLDRTGRERPTIRAWLAKSASKMPGLFITCSTEVTGGRRFSAMRRLNPLLLSIRIAFANRSEVLIAHNGLRILPLSPRLSRMPKPFLTALLCAGAAALAAEPFIPSVPDKQPEPPFPPTPPEAGITMLVPGFTVRELPVKLTNLNNLEYAPDGRLFAGGYDGRFHVLRDTNGDGLEDKVDTFAPATNENYPLGMAVKDGALYTVLTNEVVRFRDTDGDGVPETRETVIKNFDDPELMKAGYLMHRRVDSSMAIFSAPIRKVRRGCRMGIRSTSCCTSRPGGTTAFRRGIRSGCPT